MICYYDNPEVQLRECWISGSKAAITTRQFIDHPPEFNRWPMPIHPWIDGQIIGDPDAMKTTIQKVAHRGDK